MIKTLLKYFFILVLVLAGCGADQHTKKWARNNLKDKPAIPLVRGCLELGFTENHGMVFGIFNNSRMDISRYLLVGTRAVVLIALFIFIFIQRKRSLLFLAPFLLLASGALGNLIDGITTGQVIDFIHIHLGSRLDWPFLFNLADVYVCLGMGILLLKGLFTNWENVFSIQQTKGVAQ